METHVVSCEIVFTVGVEVTRLHIIRMTFGCGVYMKPCIVSYVDFQDLPHLATKMSQSSLWPKTGFG
jgi:hypothetical protein